jgi:DNA-binding NtrC family response regulator
MAEKKENILIIEDDPVYRNLSKSILKERFNTFATESPSRAFQILEKEQISFVICDYLLPEMNGLKILDRIKKDHPHIEVIMISDSGDMNTVIEALRKGASDFFRKPFSATDLWVAIERSRRQAVINQNLADQKNRNKRLKDTLKEEIEHEIVGKTEIILEIRKQMEMVAATPDTSVLIIGESGTGKELVARGIHNLSARREEEFKAINMSATPSSLFESEFFGHKKGSFTGAISDRAGWFESANKGTLFLDEIGEMTPDLQVKMLRVLEDRSYTKVGAQTQQFFNVRIVAATNKSIETLTDGKSFRQDLFHRLGTFIIQLPPLRERRTDIPLLTEYFLTFLSKKMGKGVYKIHPDTYQLFNNYDFPGNIRELKNMIERALILCQGDELLPSHFDLLTAGMKQHHTEPSSVETYDLKEIEKETIIRALEETNYNKAEASRLLNLDWNALYRRLKKYGIEIKGEQ